MYGSWLIEIIACIIMCNVLYEDKIDSFFWKKNFLI